MRWACIATLSLSLSAGASAAEAGPPQPDDPAAGSFWREVIEPHGATVAAILARARTSVGKAAEAAAEDDAVDRRTAYLSDAYGMLRYARKLSPENPEVLSLLGTTADELGRTRQALDALEACARILGPERAGVEITGRLGMIYLRLGKLDAAIRWLRAVQNPLAAPENAAAAVHLATATAARGDMARAIDGLVSALPAQISYFTDPITLVSFALAVHYDRDEQRAAAFEVLDRMSATLQHELGAFMQRALGAMRFAPAEDAYYYRALLYEALGDYTEARAEWALYASVPDAAWRRRALDHVQAIDRRRAGRPDALPVYQGALPKRVPVRPPSVVP